MSDDLVSRLRDAQRQEKSISTYARLCRESSTALTEARAEIERLRAKPPLLDAQSLPGVDALVKTLEAQLDEALRSCLAEREGRLKAESELSTLRARVREVVGPFVATTISQTGDIIGLMREDFRAARQLMEEVK